MLASLRKIADTLLALGALSLSVSLLSSVSFLCGSGTPGCLSAALTASFLTETPAVPVHTLMAESTPVSVGSIFTLTPEEFVAFVQLTSAYAILTAVLVLIALECVELRYIRQILKKQPRTR